MEIGWQMLESLGKQDSLKSGQQSKDEGFPKYLPIKQLLEISLLFTTLVYYCCVSHKFDCTGNVLQFVNFIDILHNDSIIPKSFIHRRYHIQKLKLRIIKRSLHSWIFIIVMTQIFHMSNFVSHISYVGNDSHLIKVFKYNLLITKFK